MIGCGILKQINNDYFILWSRILFFFPIGFAFKVPNFVFWNLKLDTIIFTQISFKSCHKWMSKPWKKFYAVNLDPTKCNFAILVQVAHLNYWSYAYWCRFVEILICFFPNFKLKLFETNRKINGISSTKCNL